MNCKANKIILPDIKHKCLNILFLDFGLANSYNLKKIPFSLITSIPNINAGKRRNFNMKRRKHHFNELFVCVPKEHLHLIIREYGNNNRLFNASNFLIRIIHSYSTSTSNQHMHFSDVPRQKDKNPNSNRLFLFLIQFLIVFKTVDDK
ncbi:hypothetical protein T03_9881 [Trichinella britovi]|uniref:Uncharacterized protein n=1 Tax=Trichinella britovi TaxID=45882 RepID=A0A0V1DEP9_TRIBR|nr:hypothetical protein T03_9881 [Trichinella britovi]